MSRGRQCSCWPGVDDPTCPLHGQVLRDAKPLPKRKGRPLKDVPPHGTSARYYRGCKCIPCLDAKNEKNRRNRELHRAKTRGDDWVDRRYKPIRHGTLAGARRCRPMCRECQDARNVYAREYEAKKRLARNLERDRAGSGEAQSVQ